ncbi:hypothetical protein [Enterococcus gilvus]|uniref:hypothetical protein n=1 Tax=Enterococcus gilvus TaxID=160453 RepID=UPI00345E24DE
MSDVKVIAIPDKFKIIINYGSDDEPLLERFAKIGQKIEVYTPGITLKDPDTDESLGTFDPVIQTLEITSVYPKFSIAQKIVKRTETPISQAISPMLKEKTTTKAVEINVDPSQVMGIPKAKDYISIGDPIKFV